MKLVQMPTDLIHVDVDDLPARGVDFALVAQLRAYLDNDPAARSSLAILAPVDRGSRELLMVVARRLGAALRDENIALRERGGDLQAGRNKLCYLPGSALADALSDDAAHRTLAAEAACFFDDVPADQIGRLLLLVDERSAHHLPTHLSADPGPLPDDALRQLRRRLRTIELELPQR
jgi:hypothetical protein